MAKGSARRERKVVTVLFADLVGFTQRAEQMDPEDVAALLAPYQARLKTEIERFAGTVEKFIGDAVMALFGAPVAHEDDAERAVRAALAIRDAALAEGIELRIGINTGEALITLGARPQAGETMATGDVVNTAARLQTAAPVNSILVTESTYRATQHAIDYGESEPFQAKGKVRSVQVWEPLRARAPVGVEREHRARLVGRSEELERLLQALNRAATERAPQLVTLLGVPGIGKSRLVYELSRSAKDATWRRGRSLPYGEGVTFWALGEIVKAEAGILESHDRPQAKSRLRQAVARLVPEREAAWVEANLLPLVGLETEAELKGDRRAEAFAAWRRFLEALAAHRSPLVVVFEDVHWADDSFLDFLEHLVEWVEEAPLLVLCTARPELLDRRPAWGAHEPNSQVLSLRPLNDEDTARLIGSLVRRPVLLAAVQSALLTRAGGNPLYAEQFARVLLERGSADDLPLPETVQGLIAARLDVLSPSEKGLLQDAAVVGKVFWSGAVAAVAGTTRWTVEERLRTLERKEFVGRRRHSSVEGESEYAFSHVLVRDVAYAQIPRGERAEKHPRVAEWIEALGRAEDHAEMLAHHYVSALDYTRAAGLPVGDLAGRARIALRQAGDRAAALNAPAAAGRFYAAALELCPEDDEERPYLLLRLGRELRFAGEGGDEVLAEAAHALLAIGDPAGAAEAEALRVWVAYFRGDHAAARAHCERAAALAERADDLPAKARALVLIALRFTGEEQQLRAAREALALAERFGLDDVRARALMIIGSLRAARGEDAGVSDLEQAIDVARTAGAREVASAYNSLGYFYYSFRGDLDRAFNLTLEARRAAKRSGDRSQVLWIRTWEPAIRYWQGRWDEALEAYARCISEARACATPAVAAWSRGQQANILVARGQLDEGARDLDHALAFIDQARGSVVHLPWPVVSVRLLVELGREQQAGALADELLAEWRRNPVEAVEWAVELAAGLVALARGDEFLELTRGPCSRTPWLDAAERFAAGDFAGAAEILRVIGVKPLEASARLRAAQALVAEERAAEADRQLAGALSFWRSVGAVRYVRSAEGLLGTS
jgi:predicted ATPase/class 3 adenylate cyclase